MEYATWLLSEDAFLHYSSYWQDIDELDMSTFANSETVRSVKLFQMTQFLSQSDGGWRGMIGL